MSCMSVVGVPPAVHGFGILRVWEESQAPAAEVLLTMLAGSMVQERGYNRVAAGGVGAPRPLPAGVWHAQEDMMLCHYSILEDNMEESFRFAQRRRRLLRFLNEFTPEKVENDIMDLQERIAGAQRRREEYEKEKQRVKEQHRALLESAKELEERIEMNGRIIDGGLAILRRNTRKRRLDVDRCLYLMISSSVRLA